jgi:hypothetical protein
MGNFFGSANNTATQASPRDVLQGKYNSARHNLIIAVAFTLINIVLLFVDGNSYFLFSLFTPYLLVFLGMDLTGRLPQLYTEAEYAMIEFLPDTVFYVMLAIAAVIVALFVLFWALSKKNKVGWIIAALVMVCLDSVLMLYMQEIQDIIMDIVFHIWVIVSLAGGISAYNKLKALPPEEEILDTTGEVIAEAAPEAIEEIPADLGE